MPGDLVAISDLHVGYRPNRAYVEQLEPADPDDWLVVAGDVGEYAADVEWTLRTLASRFAKVIWAPGNHELWTPPDDPVDLRGVSRYRHLVEMCRSLGVVTPEDPYETWRGTGGPVAVAPLFLLYDYSFRDTGDLGAALREAIDVGVLCADELFLHPDPYPNRLAWCHDRVTATRRRLDARDTSTPTILVNHFPLVREPTRVLRHPPFAMWCGTTLTADWHLRYGAAAVVYGHLHIPRRTVHDGVPFEEVSVGYPQEWRARGLTEPERPRPVLAHMGSPARTGRAAGPGRAT